MSLSVHIKKDFGSFCLQADFEHEEGILGLLGASGSGKSLTLKMIAGIFTPDEGRIVLDGQTLYDGEKGINLPPRKRRVGYLFQNYALFPNMTVEKNILCGLHGEKDKARRREKLFEAAKLMQLTELLSRYPSQLSGGQQQRAALARIMVSDPKLLLLDEPFSALDSYLRDQLQIQVRELLSGFQKDVVLVSHSRDEVYRLCSRLALIDQGEILECGDTKAVFANPGSRMGAALTGCKNIALAKKVGEYEVEVPEWGIRLKTGEPVREGLQAVGIRAHYFNPRGNENVFPVRAVSEMEEPFETTIMFRYEGQPKETPALWWRIVKEKKPQTMPERLGIAAKNVLLLYR